MPKDRQTLDKQTNMLAVWNAIAYGPSKLRAEAVHCFVFMDARGQVQEAWMGFRELDENDIKAPTTMISVLHPWFDDLLQGSTQHRIRVCAK